MVSRHLQEYGETLEGAAAAILEFNKGLIDALWDIVPAIKPQAAYYEVLGWPGIRAWPRPSSMPGLRVCS